MWESALVKARRRLRFIKPASENTDKVQRGFKYKTLIEPLVVGGSSDIVSNTPAFLSFTLPYQPPSIVH